MLRDVGMTMPKSIGKHAAYADKSSDDYMTNENE